MRNYTFAFEVQTLMEQFVAAFNDIIIKRYDNTNSSTPPTSGIPISFVYAPKQRAYESLSTPAPGGITVPAVAVSIASISRDTSRVFNKLEGFLVPNNTQDIAFMDHVLQPVPINIGVNMHIITKFQADMDQIITNFVPYCDPYIVISWKLPSYNDIELRTEVLWSGNINMVYPNDLGATQAFRVTADTSFIIKGWLFKKQGDVVKKIYTIKESFFTSDNPQHDSSILRGL